MTGRRPFRDLVVKHFELATNAVVVLQLRGSSQNVEAKVPCRCELVNALDILRPFDLDDGSARCHGF
jgi:hypothetical protein